MVYMTCALCTLKKYLTEFKTMNMLNQFISELEIYWIKNPVPKFYSSVSIGICLRFLTKKTQIAWVNYKDKIISHHVYKTTEN